MARAGTPHRNAFELIPDCACEGAPWIDAPQLWQNCAFALSFVPQLLQNRGCAAEGFVAMLQGMGRWAISRFERTIDLCRACLWCGPSPDEEGDEHQSSNHEEHGDNIEENVETCHGRFEQDPLAVLRGEVGFDLVRRFARPQPFTHYHAHLPREI